MKINIQPTLIFRTPRFSYQAELADCWEDLKSSIAISSQTFYETIKEVEAKELLLLPPKIYFTIWKYFNRAKYRSTPYGTFASFSILSDGIKTGDHHIVIDEAQKVTSLIDWPVKNTIHFNFSQLIANNCQLFSNSSYYLTPDTLRYIACSNGLFELAEIDQDPFVIQVLEHCLKPIRINQLVEQLGLGEEEVVGLYELLGDMHELQLIFTNYDANIIGEDYFSRIGFKQGNKTGEYIIAGRNAEGGIPMHTLNNVPQALSFLQGVFPAGEREALKQFITRFRKKFEDKEVSLLQALDPEMGVGYDELEQAGTHDDLIGQLNRKRTKDEGKDTVKSVIAQKLNKQQFKLGEAIFLNKLSVKPAEKVNPLPNSISILMTMADDLIFVDQIGGATANALSGRFTMANQTVADYCKQIAVQEQEANPEVLFFDVAYMVEATVDNINRRKLVYDYQLSILNFDTSASPLMLNDIQISVHNSEVVLRSKSLNRRIVPKMASAYNYTRSDLSVFRLLCDLQHHHVQTSLSLPLDSLFPDLDYYPRLQYQNLVLSSAKWRVNKSDFIENNQLISVDKCRLFLSGLQVSNWFKAGASDQTLCFNLHQDEDLVAFVQYMQKQDQVYLEEVVLPTKSYVTDKQGRPYLAQFILNLSHQDQIYRGIAETENSTDVKEVFPPGQEWLYFEIYCHQQRSDQLLAGVISTFTTEYEKQIKSWFFIRYNEGGDHIRFRILLQDQNDGYRLTQALVKDLDEYLASGLVSDIQIKTYKRELYRYGAKLISAVEYHFNQDSKYVLSLFENNAGQLDKYHYCLKLISAIESEVDFNTKDFLELAKLISGIFNQEHELDASDFKKLNAQYQVFKNHTLLDFTTVQEDRFNVFKKSFIQVLRQCSPEKRFKLFSDLMHMHVNRLFNKDQRVYETVMYYFLVKDLQRKKAVNG